MEETIKVYITDRSYDNPERYPGLDEIEASKKYKEELEAQLMQCQENSDCLKIKPISQVNIGAGADLPAFLLEIVPPLGTTALFALFFSGKLINQNIDAWLSIGTKFVKFAKLTGGYFNRSAALLFALAGLNEQKKESFNSIQLLEYRSMDGRFESEWKNIKFENSSQVSDELPEEFIAGEIHYFRVLVDGEEIEFLVRCNELIIREIKKN